MGETILLTKVTLASFTPLQLCDLGIFAPAR